MATTRRDLFISIGAGLDSSVTTASKAARTALLSIGDAAGDVQEEVRRAFADLGKDGGIGGLKELERSSKRTFDAIQRNLREALSAAPDQQIRIFDANAAEQSAAAAERAAAQLRLEADAAGRVAQRAGEAGQGQRVLAASTEAAALEAEQHAVALRTQANLLTEIAREAGTYQAVQGRTTAGNRQQAAAMQNLGFQFQDFTVQVASGQSAFIAFAQQMPQAANALTGFEGRLGAIGAALSSVGGILAIVAVTALTPFLAKLLEGNNAIGDQIDKLKQNAIEADAAAAAKRAFKSSEEAARDAVRGLTDELERQNLALRTNAENQNINARGARDRIAGEQTAAQERLRQLEAAQRADAAALQGTTGDRGFLTTRIGRRSSEIDQLKRDIAERTTALEQAERAYQGTRVALAREAAKRLADPEAAINKLYDDRILKVQAEADEQIRLGRAVDARLTKQLKAIETERQADLERERARKRSDAAEGRGAVTPGVVGGLLKDAFGGTITSTTGGKHVRNSFHYRGQAVDYVPSGGVGAVSKAQIRELLESQGISVKELLGPGDKNHSDHFHVAFGKTQQGQDAIDRDRQSAARAAEAARLKRERDEEAINQLHLRALEQNLDLQRGRVTDIAAGARLDEEAVRVEQERLDSAVQAGVEQKRWTQAKADEVTALNASSAALKIAAIRQAAGQRLLDQQLELDRAAIGQRVEVLQLQADLATTAGERRRIARELLEADLAERRRIAGNKAASDDPELQAEGFRELDQVDRAAPLLRDRLDRQNEDPLQSYVRRLRESAGDMDEALAGVKARGLQNLEDGLVGIISGTESVAGAFKRMAGSIIADLARIAVQKLIVSAIGGSFLGFADGGAVPGFAGGGAVFGAGGPRDDKIPAWLSNGEFVFSAEAVKRFGLPMLTAMNDNRVPGFADGGLVAAPGFTPRIPSIAAAERSVGRRDRLVVEGDIKLSPTKEFDARMEGLAIRTVSAAADPIAQLAEGRTRRGLARADLPNGWS